MNLRTQHRLFQRHVVKNKYFKTAYTNKLSILSYTTLFLVCFWCTMTHVYCTVNLHICLTVQAKKNAYLPYNVQYLSHIVFRAQERSEFRTDESTSSIGSIHVQPDTLKYPLYIVKYYVRHRQLQRAARHPEISVKYSEISTSVIGSIHVQPDTLKYTLNIYLHLYLKSIRSSFL